MSICRVVFACMDSWPSLLVGTFRPWRIIFIEYNTPILYPIYITHSENPSPYVRGVRRSGVSPEFRGGKNGIICARARSSVYATEWGIFEIFSTKTILQTVDAQKVRQSGLWRQSGPLVILHKKCEKSIRSHFARANIVIC